jgi:Flp pilus assembly protein TadG
MATLSTLITSINNMTRQQLQAEAQQRGLKIDRRSSNDKLREAIIADINTAFYQPTLPTNQVATITELSPSEALTEITALFNRLTPTSSYQPKITHYRPITRGKARLLLPTLSQTQGIGFASNHQLATANR